MVDFVELAVSVGLSGKRVEFGLKRLAVALLERGMRPEALRVRPDDTTVPPEPARLAVAVERRLDARDALRGHLGVLEDELCLPLVGDTK